MPPLWSEAPDALIVLKSDIGIKAPVGQVARPHGVDVGVVGQQTGTGAHAAQGVAHTVDFRRVAEFFHFRDDAANDSFFMATGRGQTDEIAQKGAHVGEAAAGVFENVLCGKPEGFVHSNLKRLKVKNCLAGITWC